MAIYRYKKNDDDELIKVKINAAEIKHFIKKQHGWTDEQYRKNYDIFKNKLRTYERIEGKPKQSPAELLYKQAKAMERYGSKYTKSATIKYIESLPSYSAGKRGAEAVKTKRFQARLKDLKGTYVNNQFKGLIEYNAGAQKIYEALKNDPDKLEKALTDYANKLNIKITESEKGRNTAADYNDEYRGETYGSSNEIDFNINDYL